MQAERAAGGALVLIAGRPASGKSYFARLVAERLSAELLQTDNLRKQMFAVPSYSGRESGAVYAAAHRRISRLLASGRTVVFDATNLVERRRATVYRLAEQAGARLVIVLAWAPLEVIRRRLAEREAGRDPLDRSDADLAVFHRLGQVDPIPRPHLLVNTTVDLGPACALVARRVNPCADSPGRR
jgi:predicted kinase